VFLSCVFINFIFVFLTSGQDCNLGMQKRIHFRTDIEHNICRPMNNSDVSLGYQFCKNITFILYIIYNARYNNIQLLPALMPSGEQLWCSSQVQAIIVLLYRNSIYNNVGCNKHLFVCFYLVFINFIFVFLTSGQDCNSGMHKRIHFRIDMEHNICRPVNNSDVSLGYQFCKNIT
jgi:hypothetical protein